MDIIWGMLSLDHHLNMLIAMHGTLTYAVLFGIVFSEMGLPPLFFLPGDPLLFFAGALCATTALNIWVLIPLLMIAAILGSLLNYWLGWQLWRKLGDKVFAEDHRWLDKSALQRTRAFYERHGRITFIFSPFIAVVRTFAPFIGGITGMRLARFISAMVAGAVIWVMLLVVTGFYFGNIPVIRDHISSIVLIGLGLGLGSLALSRLFK